MISDAAVTAIQDSVRTEIIEVDGVAYATREVVDLRKKAPETTPLELATLTSLVDYLKTNVDKLSKDTLILHVESPMQVCLYSQLEGYFRQRHSFVRVSLKLLSPKFDFDHFYDVETFIIALQAFFVRTAERDAVLALVGNIREEGVKNHSDDGITQTIVAKAGVATVREVDVPNPVTLQPYRTFREIEQPTSKFILRMRQGQPGQKPICALFEAEGNLWKLDAIQRISEWLGARIQDVAIVA